MIPYDEEFGDIDVLKKIFCSNCKLDETAPRLVFVEGEGRPQWQIFCKKCLTVGPESKTLTGAIILWNEINRSR